MSDNSLLRTSTVAHPSSVSERINNLMQLIFAGCLGGLVGQPVNFVFRDFAPDVVSGLWARIARSFMPESVAEVWTQSDIQGLRRRLHELRVIFVLQSRKSNASFLNTLTWLIEQRRGGGQALPAVMAVYDEHIEDNPGATLLINGNPEISRAVGHWLHTSSSSPPAAIASAPMVGQDIRWLLTAVWQAAQEASRPLTPADLHLLEALMYAKTIHRAHAAGEPRQSDDLAVYESVRLRLQHTYLQRTTDTVDELTHLMIRRANALLRRRCGIPTESVAPVGARRGDSSTIDVTETDERERESKTVTFVELVNLGHVHSVEFRAVLSTSSGNPADLAEMGIVIGQSIQPVRFNSRAPPTPSADTPSVNLKKTVTWSFKQARTRFERLRKSNLIEARRKAANGPYEYVLPDELRSAQAPYAHLPSADAVRQALARQNAAVGPTSPPHAVSPGPAQVAE